MFHLVRAEYKTARELGEQCLLLAQSARDPALLLVAHRMVGETLMCLGEFTTAQEHLEDGIALHNPQRHHSLASLYGGEDPGVVCRCDAFITLWLRGYPDLALKRIQETLTLAQELSHPYKIGRAHV